MEPELGRAGWGWREIVLLATPPLLLATTYFAFQEFAGLLGPIGGYLSGFLVYWIGWCFLLPFWILGWGRLRDLFGRGQPRFGRPAWLGLLALALPLLLGYVFEFPKVVPEANLPIIVLSAVLSVVNGTLEEVLWRGTYVAIFGERLWSGYLYPTFGFAVWHFAPQSIFPSSRPGGTLALVLVAGLMGFMWGWVARRSGSIRWAVISHILFDFAGLGGRIYL